MKPFRPMAVETDKITGPGSPRLTPHKKASERCEVEERQVEGIWLYDMSFQFPEETTNVGGGSDRPESDSGPPKRVLYFAGGGWQMPASREHWALGAHLACHLSRTTVTLVSYPLAPNNPAHVSLPQVKKLYHTLMRQAADKGERVIVAGDSSGGNIALCLTLWALEDPVPDSNECDPAALFVISPSTDLRHQHPDIPKAAKHDPILTISSILSTSQKWCKGDADEDKYAHETGMWTPNDPRVSPMLANVDLFVKRGIKVHGLIGTNDVLAPEAIAFRDLCGDKGVEGKWIEWEGQMHCFPIAFEFGLKESEEAVAWMVDVLQQT